MPRSSVKTPTIGGRRQADRPPSDGAGQREGERPLVGAMRVPIEQLTPDPEQPRQTFDPERLAELADSLKGYGVLQPLLVREAGYLDDGRTQYMIVAGGRRYAAAQQAGLTHLPVLVRDTEAVSVRILQLTENIQREALDPVEEARALKELMDLQHFSSRNVAERLHRSHTYVADRLKLIEHEDVARRLQESPALAPSVAAQIAREPDAQVRQDLLDRAARGELRREDVRRLRHAKVPPGAQPLEQRERTLREVGRDMGASEAQLHAAAQARKEDPTLTPAEAIALAVCTPTPTMTPPTPTATGHGAVVPEAPAAPAFGASATVALAWDEERAVVEIPVQWLHTLGWEQDARLRLRLQEGRISVERL